MKKILALIFVAIIALGVTKNVFALEDVYYTNPNGVELTQEEYDFLAMFYGEPYVDIMTKAQYEEFVEEDLMNSDVRIKKVDIIDHKLPLYYSSNGTRSDTHSTPDKTLQIGAACLPTYCIMSLLNTWHVNPATRSWDNIGTYISGTTLKSHSSTYVASSNGSVYYSNLKQTANGVGNSVKLPNTGNNLVVNMSFKVNRNGTVFGSYQHAMNNTTEAVSENYYLDILGYGNVFLYYGTAVGVYDGMAGVDISV